VLFLYKKKKKSEREVLKVLSRTKEGNERFTIPICNSSGDMIKAIISVKPQIKKYSIHKAKDIMSNELLRLEKQQIIKNYKFGVLYVKEGQRNENEMYSNVDGSPQFDEFLNFLGDKVVLQGFSGFRGGLDVNKNSTGKYSVYTTFEGYGIMYHISTYLPYFPLDTQQLERKRHLGNDVAIIIFKEGDLPFSPNCLTSEFNHVFAVFSKDKSSTSDKTRYRVDVASKPSVVQTTPFLPYPPIFDKGEAAKEFLLTKLINLERSALKSQSFAEKLAKTRKLELLALVERFGKKKQKKPVS